jgi:hypothetical protein
MTLATLLADARGACLPLEPIPPNLKGNHETRNRN